MIKILLIITMLFPLVVGCTTTSQGKKRECQPECRVNKSEITTQEK